MTTAYMKLLEDLSSTLYDDIKAKVDVNAEITLNMISNYTAIIYICKHIGKYSDKSFYSSLLSAALENGYHSEKYIKRLSKILPTTYKERLPNRNPEISIPDDTFSNFVCDSFAYYGSAKYDQKLTELEQQESIAHTRKYISVLKYYMNLCTNTHVKNIDELKNYNKVQTDISSELAHSLEYLYTKASNSVNFYASYVQTYQDDDDNLKPKFKTIANKLCPYCNTGHIRIKSFYNLTCDNKDCFYGVNRHSIEEVSESGTIFYPELRRGSIVKDYWTMDDDEINRITELQVGDTFNALYIPNATKSKSLHSDKLEYSETQWQHKREKCEVREYEIIDIHNEGMVKVLDTTNRNKQCEIPIISYSESYDAYDALFSVNRPKMQTPHLKLVGPTPH